MLSQLRRLWSHVGRRGSALLFFCFLDFVYAYSLFNPAPEIRRSPTATFLNEVVPLWVWGCIWLAAGIVCGVQAFSQRDRYGFAAAMAIKVLWGLIYLMLAFAGFERAYVSAALWLCLAGWVAIISTWPEPSQSRQ